MEDWRELLGTKKRSHLLDRAGRKVPISSLQGKVVGLLFSAHWHAPCIQAAELLATVYTQLNPKPDANANANASAAPSPSPEASTAGSAAASKNKRKKQKKKEKQKLQQLQQTQAVPSASDATSAAPPPRPQSDTDADAESERTVPRPHPGFEMVFISWDHTATHYQQHRKHMPWLALPFQDARVEEISVSFGISGNYKYPYAHKDACSRDG